MGYGKEPLNLLAATVEAGDGNPRSPDLKILGSAPLPRALNLS